MYTSLTNFVHSSIWIFFHPSCLPMWNIEDMWGLQITIFTCMLARLCCVEMPHVDVETPFDSPDSTLKLITFWQSTTTILVTGICRMLCALINNTTYRCSSQVSLSATTQTDCSFNSFQDHLQSLPSTVTFFLGIISIPSWLHKLITNIHNSHFAMASDSSVWAPNGSFSWALELKLLVHLANLKPQNT